MAKSSTAAPLQVENVFSVAFSIEHSELIRQKLSQWEKNEE
jgi:hypothetical protein